MKIPLDDYAWGVAVANELVATSPTVRADGDGLPGLSALADFLAAHRLRRDDPPTDEDVRQVHFLRREVRGIIETETADQAVAGATVLIRRAGLPPILERDDEGRWEWRVPTTPEASLADELAALVAIGILGVVRTLGHERFRPCAAPGCRGVFADVSRAGRRRYCMPDLCGNRVNVANHRARQREGTLLR
ncbi:CGNR zinc finger domain-containing protein [Actinoallomurus rhizosphaericola]|uniref:CGNR zinc finger domain-containing protein n=1 Tax=Actinoallomurus rhizosphaericola TaxID=2952536 RepID=UPI0020920BAC|nr:CGNR zinc finger domain-containing protein [Actinoallomurus rhizosphaericola]MCO5996302.1 CGNR zinc finger domain-containing protein [Actinoallomurus rhizosphaericola]